MAFMAALPAIVGGVSSVLGGVLQNRRASSQANRSMEFEAAQAQRQMDFEERMSGSAHQREVKDLTLAGLNPMLSAMGGNGASTPSGARGSGSQAPVQNVGAGVSSALQASNIVAQNQLLKAQANQANANAGLATASAQIPATIGDVVNGIKKFVGEQTGTDTAGVLGGIKGGVTDIFEVLGNSAAAAKRGVGDTLGAGAGVLRRGFETMKHSASSIGDDGVELLRRVDDLIDKANSRFLERFKGERK